MVDNAEVDNAEVIYEATPPPIVARRVISELTVTLPQLVTDQANPVTLRCRQEETAPSIADCACVTGLRAEEAFLQAAEQ
jgi:hypothetical protein